MLLRQTSRQPPLPVVPRPFWDEALGGWVGRLAAKYNISVAQLFGDYGLPIAHQASPMGWLYMPQLSDEVLDKLAWLGRIDIRYLQQIQSPSDASSEYGCLYCAKCLFMNPADVFSPYWKRQWFRPSFHGCPLHPTSIEWLPRGVSSNCKNFDSVLKAASRRERIKYVRGLSNGH
jgi:hypothetical protein